jgi:hypothetical protein
MPALSSLPPRGIADLPPAAVLAGPRAPTLAGAVALAAGHFQPLLRLESFIEVPSDNGISVRRPTFRDVLKLGQAWQFARAVEARVASVIPRYKHLGDDCDFLTLSGDWPYRYSYDGTEAHERGLYALDDLIGRRFDEPQTEGQPKTPGRWAYTGRLLGDPAASVARAMAALFLPPNSALLWNTYHDDKPWSSYTMASASSELTRALGRAGLVVHRSGREADLASWHREFDPVNRFGMMMINSSGGPAMFTIRGGAGRPSDVPLGVPAAVAMTHSYSAADPTDEQTIAGRWLAQGAFVYFGSIQEPFLLSFRTPRLISELMAAEVPFVAALRQGEGEACGFPWRLVYLGDPLYRLRSTHASRITAGEWQKIAPEYGKWPVAEITASKSDANSPSVIRLFGSEDDRFRWCLDQAIADPIASPPRSSPTRHGDQKRAVSLNLRQADWQVILREIHRDQLSRGLRPFFDDSLIDTLMETGALVELISRLAQIPPAECGPRAWQALETCGMDQLALQAEEVNTNGGFGRVLDVWEPLMRLKWPKSSQFPSHFTERVAALAGTDPGRLPLWLDRLRKASAFMATEPLNFSHAAVVAAERARAESQFGGLSSTR